MTERSHVVSVRPRLTRQGWYGFLVGLAVGVAATVTAAQLTVPAPQAPETDTLVILSGRDDSVGSQRQRLVEEWNARHPDTPAEIVELPSDADAQHAEMLARAQSGHDSVDIYNLDVVWVAEFAENGYLRPLEQVDTTAFLEPPLATCRYDGQLWALPFNTDVGLLYYNTELVPEPPATMDDLSRAIDTMLDANAEVLAGYTGQLGNYEGLTVNALEAIWAFGGDVLVDGEVVIDSEPTAAALRWLATVNDPNNRRILHDSRFFGEAEATSAFREERVAFMRNWPVAYRQLEPEPDPERPVEPADYGFAVTRLPGNLILGGEPGVYGGRGVLGGQNLAVARTSQRPEAAQELIEFLTSRQSQATLLIEGGLAAIRADAYGDAAAAGHPYAGVLLTAIGDARARPITPHYPRFSEVFRAIVLEAMADDGVLPPDATERLERALDGY